MSSQSAAGRRRSNNRQYSAEDQALNMISKEAEARLAAKRAARAEAREIRMKEIEKQQKKSEETQDKVYELTSDHAAAKVRQQLSGSRRGSTESTDSAPDVKDVDYKAEVRELEEKYKAAMMTSAQLDNEKQSLVYQVELLKDQLEEQDEGYTELQREYKDKCRECDFQKRDLKSMEHELDILKQQLAIKDRLIEESGFVIVSNESGEPVLEKQSEQSASSNGPLPSGAILVSPESRNLLEKAGGTTLGSCSTLSQLCTKPVQVDSKADVSVSTSSALMPAQHHLDTVDSASHVQEDANSNDKGEKKEKLVVASVDGSVEAKSRTSDETLHESSDVVTNIGVVCVHDVVKSSPMSDSNSGDSLVQAAGAATSESSPNEEGERDPSCLSNADSGIVLDVPALTVTHVEKQARTGGEESEDEGEFFDAVSTPSPFDKTGKKTFDLESPESEGSSVDGEMVLITRNKESRNAEGATRQSLVIEGATESESSTEAMPQSLSLGSGVDGQRDTDIHGYEELGNGKQEVVEESINNEEGGHGNDRFEEKVSSEGNVGDGCPQFDIVEEKQESCEEKEAEITGGELEIEGEGTSNTDATIEMEDQKKKEIKDEEKSELDSTSTSVLDNVSAVQTREQTNVQSTVQVNESIDSEQEQFAKVLADDTKVEERETIQEITKDVDVDLEQCEETDVGREKTLEVPVEREKSEDEGDEVAKMEIADIEDTKTAEDEGKIEAVDVDDGKIEAVNNEEVASDHGKPEIDDEGIANDNNADGGKITEAVEDDGKTAELVDDNGNLDREQTEEVDTGDAKVNDVAPIEQVGDVELTAEEITQHAAIDTDDKRLEVQEEIPDSTKGEPTVDVSVVNVDESESKDSMMNKQDEPVPPPEKAMLRTTSIEGGASETSENEAPEDYDLDDIDNILSEGPNANEGDDEAPTELDSQVTERKNSEATGDQEAACDPESSTGATGGSEKLKSGAMGKKGKVRKEESLGSLDLDDLEGALDKKMSESEKSKSQKKTKKFKLFKKVFK